MNIHLQRILPIIDWKFIGKTNLQYGEGELLIEFAGFITPCDL